jgi:hypothetical protein
MPVKLNVRQVRDEILRAAGGPVYGLSKSSTRMAGTLFHEIFADLFGPDARLAARAALAGGAAAEEWNARLREHIYRLLLGPRIEANRAALQTASREVLDLWKALEELARWLAGILDEAWRRGAFSVAAQGGAADLLISAEEPFWWRLREPGWIDSVEIGGVPDAVLRMPGGGRWCVLELKTGQSAPEADLAQACLYRQMLAAAEPNPGSLALVRFHPKLEEKVFAAHQLKPAEARLKALIGRLAGVLPGPAPQPARTRPAVTEPAPAKPEYTELGRKLLDVFREYNSPVELAGSLIAGPAFLRFPVQPARSVRPESVRKLAAAVQVRLGLQAPPFIHTAGSRLVVDVARPDRQPVLFAAVRGQLPTTDPARGCSKLPVGLDLEGNLRMADLADSADCHLLVAGATGSGKTEWLRTMIAGLVLTNTPQTLQLLLVDPKRNAFNELAGSPYLWGDRRIVYPDEVEPVGVFDRLVQEMETRYHTLQAAGVDHLAELPSHARLPRIVCVCEEYPDLLFRGRKEIEERIRRLGQKARAAGIHLVLAVQQPSREIVKGALQANIPARVGLRVTSRIESKMLLDRGGAEDLLGNGDLLFKDIGEPVRLQGVYLPAEQRRTIFGGGRLGGKLAPV